MKADQSGKILEFPDCEQQGKGKSVVGYGASGQEGTPCSITAAIRTDFLDYTVDRNPYKQGQVPAGQLIFRVYRSGDRIRETKPDYVLILPWNLKDEIARQLSYVREWGGRLAVPIPEVEILP